MRIRRRGLKGLLSKQLSVKRRQDLLYLDLPNPVEEVTKKMLAEVAEAFTTQAESETQPDGPAMAVDNVTEMDGAPVGHISKNIAVEAGGDGLRAGSSNRIDEHANTATDDRAKTSAVDDPMGRADSRQQSCSEAHGSRTAPHQNNDLLQQVTLLRATVQGLGKQMQDVQNLGKSKMDLQLKESGARKITRTWKR